MTRYLLDANVFIQARNTHYGFDFRPAFWDWLTEGNKSGKIASVEKVAIELYSIDDDLAGWTRDRGRDFFLVPDRAVISAYQHVSEWAFGSDYQPSAVATFLQVADSQLIAYASAHNYTVVTHEVPAKTERKIKIPNACVNLNLRRINPYEMLRQERARFILERRNGSGSTRPIA